MPLIAIQALLERFGLTGGIVGDRVAAGVTQDTKKQRELYIGNLAVGAVTPVMLKELFTAPPRPAVNGVSSHLQL